MKTMWYRLAELLSAICILFNDYVSSYHYFVLTLRLVTVWTLACLHDLAVNRDCNIITLTNYLLKFQYNNTKLLPLL
jgi:hypothetical protein